VSEYRVLRRIFGPKRGWRKLQNVFSSPSIIRMIKSRRIRWAWHVARTGEKRNAYRIFGVSQNKRDHWEEQDLVGGQYRNGS
jgi:hypothetical protein